MPLATERITTRRGIESDVFSGGSGPAMVFFHGAGGTSPDDPLLQALTNDYTVYAPVWPGFGVDETETAIEDMLDFTLHGWDLVDALNLDGPPILMGHSMGAMIAAEMACIARNDLSRLVLLAPAGLWIDSTPLPDLFAMLPFEMAETLFHDPALGEKLMTGGVDFSDNDALSAFMVGNSRRMGTAGKILFPIPNRRLSKRLHRIGVPTLVVHGESDGLLPVGYPELWQTSISGSTLVAIAKAGHMPHVEQTAATHQAVSGFLGA